MLQLKYFIVCALRLLQRVPRILRSRVYKKTKVSLRQPPNPADSLTAWSVKAYRVTGSPRHLEKFTIEGLRKTKMMKKIEHKSLALLSTFFRTFVQYTIARC